MSKSDYQNLKEAYLSNVKPIRENYGRCEKVTDICKYPYFDNNGKYVQQDTTTQYEVFKDDVGRSGWYDVFPLGCSKPKTVNCPDKSKFGCLIGPWSECINGIQTRKIDPPGQGGDCPESATSRECGTPCVYKYKEKPRDNTCTYEGAFRIPCFPFANKATGKNIIDYDIITPAKNGGSCNPYPKIENCNNADNCSAKNLVDWVLNDNTFSSKPGDFRYERFKTYLQTTLNNTNQKDVFLNNVLEYMNKYYEKSKGNANTKCQIEKLLEFIFKTHKVSLKFHSIAQPTTNVCRL